MTINNKHQIFYVDLFKHAIEVERHGVLFYQQACRNKNVEVAQFFQKMGENEKNHIDKFVTLLNEIEAAWELYGRLDIDSREPAEIKDLVYGWSELEKKSGKVENIAQALQFAIDFESYSIEYYSSLRKMIMPKQVKAIDGIINEEKAHLKAIYSLKSKYSD